MGELFYIGGGVGTLEVHGIDACKLVLVDFCLKIRLTLSLPSDIEVETFSSELWVRRDSQQLFVGRMEITAQQPPYQAQKSARALTLRMPLSAQQIRALDDARRGAAARLVVETWLGYRRAHGTPERDSVYTQLDLSVAASDWLDKMRDMGAVDVLTMSLCVPFGSQALANIVKNLRDAQEELYAGRRPREVATYVRKSLEALTAWQNDTEEIRRVSNAGFNNLADKSVEDRLRLVRRALQVLVGAAPHENDVAYDVPTARASVGMAIAVLEAYVDRDRNRT